MSGYDTERVNKISQIMPQFSKVAAKGDTVLMGLEGDPLFPFQDMNSRPKAVISGIEHRKNDSLIKLQMHDGTTKEVSSMTLAADQVWEFDDDSFQNVMERQKREMDSRAEEKVEPYRGIEHEKDIITELRSEIHYLKRELSIERENSKNFHNTMIASMNEMAGDICKLDTSGNKTEFCRTLKGEYEKMIASRSEAQIESNNYRGIDAADTQEMDDFSADDTDFF